MSDVQSGDLTQGANSIVPVATDVSGNQGSEGSGGNQVPPVTNLTDPSQIPDWHASVKAELKGHPSLVKFKTQQDVNQAYVDLEAKTANSVQIPGENATDEERARYNTLLRGGIDSPDKYDLSGVKLPDGTSLTAQGVKDVQEMAFKNGLTQAQTIAAVEWDAQRQQDAVKEVRQAMQTAKRDSDLKLRKDWGGEYDANFAAARTATQKYGDQEAFDLLKNSGLGSHPAIVRMMGNVGLATAEATVPSGESPNVQATSNFPKAERAAAERKQRLSGGGV
jgi:hypothetical protein